MQRLSGHYALALFIITHWLFLRYLTALWSFAAAHCSLCSDSGHFAVTFGHYPAALWSLCSGSFIIMQRVSGHFEVALWSLCSGSLVIMQRVCDHYKVALWSLCIGFLVIMHRLSGHYGTALWALWNGFLGIMERLSGHYGTAFWAFREGRPGRFDVSPCLESHGCHLIPPSCLLSRVSALLFLSCDFSADGTVS